jgi:hypothetical protein
MISDAYPVRWTGRQAVVPLPEHIGLSNAGLIREELLSVINRGATTLIADMTDIEEALRRKSFHDRIAEKLATDPDWK